MLNANCDKISIIIPMYNKAKYITEALKSCIDQSYNNYEIIVIDDCSTDDSFLAASNYLEKSKFLNFLLVKNEFNRGVSYTRNYGINLSSGKYIIFLDADDLLHTRALEVLYATIKKQDADCIVGERTLFTTEYGMCFIADNVDSDIVELRNPPLVFMVC